MKPNVTNVPKNVYVSPKLTVYGDIRTITKGQSTIGAVDAGGPDKTQ